MFTVMYPSVNLDDFNINIFVKLEELQNIYRLTTMPSLWDLFVDFQIQFVKMVKSISHFWLKLFDLK